MNVREPEGRVSSPFDGSDIATIVARIGPLQPTAAVRIALQAAQDLGASPASGARELRTSDLFLKSVGDAASPRFIVRVTTRETGTDSRDDVWNLGVALWSMLVGRAPGEVPGSVHDAAPWVEPALSDVVAEMLRADRHAAPRLATVVRSLTTLADGDESLQTADLAPISAEVRSRKAVRRAGQQAVALTPVDPSFRRHEGSPTNPPPDAPGAPPDATDATEQESLIGETLGGRYRLDRLLGHGGMGAVYEAEGPDGARVAVKVVLGDHRKPAALRRFVREARTTTAIDDPHVVRVLDVDGDATRSVPYIVMELLKGTDLEQAIRTHGALEADVVARMFVEACRGLAAAHERGVVHRDIKPANIFLHQGAGGRITTKICDFGIAKQLQSELESDRALDSTDLTHTGSMIGSPPYMSPEQARSSKDIDARSDVWSLGAALYEALAGVRVWEGRSSLGELMAAIIREPVPRVDETAAWIDPALADVVARTLQKDPALRYQSMPELAAALEPFAIAPEAFDVASVRPVASHRRSSAASHRPPPQKRVSETSRAFATSGESVPTRRRSPVLTQVVVLVALAMLGGIVTLLVMRGRDSTPTTTSATAESTAPSPSASTTAPIPSPTIAASIPTPPTTTTATNPLPIPTSTDSAASAPTPKPTTVVTKPTVPKKPNAEPSVPNIF